MDDLFFLDQIKSKTHFCCAVEDVHFQDRDALAGFDFFDQAFLPEERAGRDVDFVAFHISLGDVDDVVVVEELVKQDLFVLVQRTVEVIRVKYDIKAREPFDVVYKFLDVVCFNK